MKIKNIVNEFAPANKPSGGNYLKALASAWYNDTYNTGDLNKGIKSQEDVERILERGIHCGDGKIRKYMIGYNHRFDGVDIQSDDHYEYADYDDAGNDIDSRTGKPWGPYDVVAFAGNELDESVSEAYQFKGGFPFDVDHMPGAVNKYNRTPVKPTSSKKWFTDKKEWDRATDKINAEVFDDMSDFTIRSEGETVVGNSAVWAKWNNATQKGYIDMGSLSEGEVVAFPKKHKGDLASVNDCPKCGGDLQGGKYMGHQVKVCMPCKQVYLPPNSGIDQQGNPIKEAGVAEAMGEHEFKSANGPVSVTTEPGRTVVKRKEWDSSGGSTGPNQGTLNAPALGGTRRSDYDSGDYSDERSMDEAEQQKGADYRDPPEADYGDDYQDMVKRMKQLAGAGPLKTVHDPAKRVYKNVPTAVQPGAKK